MIARAWSGLLALAAAWVALAGPAAAQAPRVERVTVHAPALEGNLEGNSADRTVYVVLPPSYGTDAERRYPVLYFLHGYFAHAETYMESADVVAGATAAMADGPEFLIVLPDSFTRHAGSMYSNSPTIGNFETFLTRDLVAYVDGHYRTLANRESRGLAGHSMGGYGTLKLGMKYADVYSSIYAMSPCCTAPAQITPDQARTIEAMSEDDAAQASFFARAGLASFAAWSPAPDKPPFYFDTGLREDGTIDPLVLGRLAANAPLAMLPQYLPALRTLEAIGLEVGTGDFLFAEDVAMHEALLEFGIDHRWATYDGDHLNRVAERFRTVVLPFFQQHLAQQ